MKMDALLTTSIENATELLAKLKICPQGCKLHVISFCVPRQLHCHGL